MADSDIVREWDGDRLVLRLSGAFDRSTAWELRARLEHETAPELLVDFSLVRDFSDLGIAVLAHGVQTTARRVLFRGLRQHQLRIFRYCGVLVEEVGAREETAQPTAPPAPGTGATERRA